MSKNIKWKIPERNNSQVLKCTPFWVAWWNLCHLLHPSQEVHHRFVQWIHGVQATSVIRQSVTYHSAVLKQPLFYLIMTPKSLFYLMTPNECRDTINLDMPKRSHKLLPSSEKVCMDRDYHHIYYVRLGTIHGFRYPLGVLDRIPLS